MSKLIKREIFKELLEHLEKKEITLIVGARQVGKTTLMKALLNRVKVSGKKTLYLNLDVEGDKKYFVSQEMLLRKLELEFGNERGFVFIDEIQRKENAGIFLKGLYDLDKNYKFVVTGSGSLELKEKIHESLAGRKQIFEIGPVSFREFVNYKTDYAYRNKLEDFFDLEPEKIRIFLKDYLSFGGYPRVILASSLTEKINEIKEIYQSYLERDISEWLEVEKREAFNLLVKILADQAGNLINFAELSNTLGLSFLTVKTYIWYLEKTFIIKKVTPYFRNKRKEITKSPNIYFNDLGLRNYAKDSFGSLESLSETGKLFENFIFNILKEKLYLTSNLLNFWRTKDGAEVDFVIVSGNKIVPIEVKYQSFKDVKIERSLKNFIDKYQPLIVIVVNLNLRKVFRINKAKIEFITVKDLLKNNSINLCQKEKMDL